MTFYLILSTAPSKKVGEKLARLLVQNRLAACVSVIPQVRSFFGWKGRLERAEESLLLAKTTRAKFARLERFLKTNHPYEVPEIIALPIAEGLPSYLKWLREWVS